MAKLYVVKTKSGSFYEIEEERHLLKKKWWLCTAGGRVEIDGLQQVGTLPLSEVKIPKNIFEFLNCQMRSGKIITTKVVAIYQLKKIAH